MTEPGTPAAGGQPPVEAGAPPAGPGTRARVLAALRAGAGRYVSGGDLARQLGVSRAAVSKQIAALRQEGYAIESVSRRGHRLLGTPDRLTPAEVQPLLTTRALGRRIEYREQVASTNEVAKALARAGAPAGTVVVAEEQTGGRGRLGRGWYSPPGVGIWLSVILRPDLAPYQASRLTLAAAVAVAEAVRQCTGVAAAIKWPNDIVAGDRKLCGILTELELDEQRIHFAVVGVGVNVNTAPEQFPPDVRATATSLRAEAGRPVPRAPLVAAILAALEAHLPALAAADGFGAVLARWRALSSTLGRAVRVLPAAGGPPLDGVAEAVDDDGALLVRAGDGTRHRVLAGEVSLRPR